MDKNVRHGILTLNIEGMMCMKNCGSTVQRALRSNAKVAVAYVNFEEAQACVFLRNPELCFPEEELVETVESIGFGASVDIPKEDNELPRIGYHFQVQGMMCLKECGATIQRACLALSNKVVSVHIDLACTSVGVVVQEGDAQSSSLFAQLLETMNDIGFPATDVSTQYLLKTSTKAVVQKLPLSAPEKQFPIELNLNYPHAMIQIGGMSCASCVRSIESGCLSHPGIVDIKVGLIAQKAEIVFDASLVTPQDIEALISEIGYEATLVDVLVHSDDTQRKIELRISSSSSPGSIGLSDTDQAQVLEYLEQLHPDVVSVQQHIGSSDRFQVMVSSSSHIGPRTLIDRWKTSPLAATLTLSSAILSGSGSTIDSLAMKASGDREIQKWKRLFRLALLFAIPSMLVHMIFPFIAPTLNAQLMHPIIHHVPLKVVLMWIFVTPIQFYVGKRFYIAAYKGLRHGMMGMDFLIVVGTSASYLYSIVSIVFSVVHPTFQGHYFFESSAMLITFVTFGKYLESLAKGRTVDALSHLMHLQPTMATLVVEDRDTENRTIPIEFVEKGDRLQVLPGSSIPVDGTVVSGSSTVNESMLTGESMPVTKSPGDIVFGSTLNQNGTLLIQSNCCGSSDTTLSQICRLIEDAQTSKAPIQAYADYIASIFAPAVLTLAITTFFVWYVLLSNHVIPESWMSALEVSGQNAFVPSLLFSISVVVIACPCALGLATPTAVMVGCGVGATFGILMKGGRALERAKDVDVVVFDKTGTLTWGQPTVTDVLSCVPHISPRDVLYYAASAEAASEHPLGKAIVHTATHQERLTLGVCTNFKAEPGRGLTATVDGNVDMALGNRTYMSSYDGFADCAVKFDQLEEEGKTVIGVAMNTTLIGLIGLSDRPREHARAVVETLRHVLGIEHIWMLTGDNAGSAMAMASAMGITEVQSGALPADKVKLIELLQSRGHVVCMIGDGLNDAPALARADVGMAIGCGTEIAVAQADMVLIKSDLRDVVTALDLARVVFRRIRTNFAFSVGYNVVGIPIAAGLFFPFVHLVLPPACAGLAMAFSSVSVVLSSLMLRHYVPPLVSSTPAPPSKKGEDTNKPTSLGVSLQPMTVALTPLVSRLSSTSDAQVSRRKCSYERLNYRSENEL